MIPTEVQEWVFPRVADGTPDAAVLHHDCGVSFQFEFNEYGGDHYVITNRHLRSWRTKIDKLAEMAGHNCFSYNTLHPDPEGVYYDRDGNVFAILFAPGTFLEHNELDGAPRLLVISESDCILTGARSEAGMALIREHLPKSIAKEIVTIGPKWKSWIKPQAE